RDELDAADRAGGRVRRADGAGAAGAAGGAVAEHEGRLQARDALAGAVRATGVHYRRGAAGVPARPAAAAGEAGAAGGWGGAGGVGGGDGGQAAAEPRAAQPRERRQV